MKIGILTYHRSHNYGAMLQAVALRKVLQDMGHDAYFIDYWPQHQKKIYRIFVWEEFWRGGIRGRLRYLKHFIKVLPPKLMRRGHFFHFYWKQIRPFVHSTKEQYDVVVYGSDQIWRKQNFGYGFNPIYFGKNDFKAKKQVSYAASMGTVPDKPEDIETVKGYVKSIDIISVREKELQSFLREKCFVEAEHTVDPTFLLSKDDWKELVSEKRIIEAPYLLFYDLHRGTFNTKDVIAFADKLHLKMIRINGVADYMPSQTDRTTDGPYEFLNLLYYADYVITSSFHGLAFALLFQKPFITSLIINKSRVISLLELVGLSDRLLADNKSLLDASPKIIVWKKVQEKLNESRLLSLDFLCNAL